MSAEKSREKTFNDQEIEARLKADLPRWYFEGGSIRRKYKTQGWKGTLMIINAIGHLAEAAWHHPDIRASFASVEVRLHTHDAGGITAKDFELAKKIEELCSGSRASLEVHSREHPTTRATPISTMIRLILYAF